ncbi:hypothetical protein BDN72DRAFT_833089 [Pluteus cervinus]|uniref:Uncharacterized protein n=1 Tax=Pluteus cervinus TaxID=181527 RepID=A0ACD3B923_9AGAR|nr:hypothetical protein BDN72DRAFT_833089 [Pluteus cervinus]
MSHHHHHHSRPSHHHHHHHSSHHVHHSEPYVYIDEPITCHHYRRTPSDASSTTLRDECPSAMPWRHMTGSYAFGESDERDHQTKQWVLEQQTFTTHSSSDRPRRSTSVRQETRYMYDADRWAKYEERFRRQLERDRMQEEVRRIEFNMRQKKEAERLRVTREKAQVRADWVDWQRREQERAEKITRDAWRRYEDKWATLHTSKEDLSFASIPWPMVRTPASVEEITLAAISLFLLSSVHSEKMSPRERIRSAQLRWHPDKFRRLLGRVKAEDREKVETAVGNIARYLNDLRTREESMRQVR